MNVLSLFNGMSFGMMALNTLDIKVDKYYSSEIDKFANQATQALFPNVIQLGDVTKWNDWDIDLSSIDLLLAGFPCQAWSMAGKQKGDSDPRGALVHDLINIWNAINFCRKQQGKPPVKFMFENVKMKKEFLDYINNLFGVDPVCINSALVSAQNRVRYYWTNIGKIEQPGDKSILLKDIIQEEVAEDFYHTDQAIAYMERGNDKWMQAGSRRADRYEQSADKEKAFTVTANIHKGVPYNYFKCGAMRGRYLIDGKRADHKVESQKGLTEQRIELRKDDKTNCLTTVQKDNLVVRATVQKNAEHTYNGKCPTITASMGIGGGNVPLMTDKNTADKFKGMYIDKDDRLKYRKLTPRECFRLQTVPEHHIDTLLSSGISNTQLYKMCGNGWTHNVITHIFKGLIATQTAVSEVA